MKKDIKVTVKINTLEDLNRILITVNNALKEECNCTCTLDIVVIH